MKCKLQVKCSLICEFARLWSLARVREHPETCWATQDIPWWDDSDLSSMSDYVPCSANFTGTKLEKLVLIPFSIDRRLE